MSSGLLHDLPKKLPSSFPRQFRGKLLETFMTIAQSIPAEVLRSRLVEGDFRLAEWTVQPRLNTLIANGQAVHIQPNVMHVLICHADAGDVVSKEQLIEKVWSDTYVTDDVLTRCISELRKAFDDDPKHPRYIQTIPKSGYRLLPRPELIPIVAQSAIQEASTQTEPAISQRSLQRRQIFSICAVAILLIGIATVWYLLSRPSAANVHSMLAVLPFQNLSNDPEQEYFADGLTA